MRLYKIGAIKIGQFTLKSGDNSPYYIDLRLIPSDPDLFAKVSDLYVNKIVELQYKPSALAGIMSAGVPFATAACIQLKLPLLQVRSEVKQHGTKRMIEGVLPTPGDSKVILIDDLISTGASKIQPVKFLRYQEQKVNDLVVLIDRSKSRTKEDLAKDQLFVHSVTTPKALLSELRSAEQVVSTSELEIIDDALSNW